MTDFVLWCGLPALVLAIGLLNLATWPRGRRWVDAVPGVSVLIPARNEEANVEACVRAALSAGPLEVCVYDDGSTDRTPQILERLAAEDRRVRVLRGVGLPEGWVGKPHACHRLGLAARGDVLLFVDADTQLQPDAIRRLTQLETSHETPVITVFPAQVMKTGFENLVVPMLHVTYLSWLPLWLIPRTRSTAFLAANGQTLWVRRQAYDRIGGFSAVRNAIVDDMAFCRRAKQAGLRVLFADGAEIARCRMYRSAREVIEGFSKNLYLGLGARPERLAFVLALYVMTFLAPMLGVLQGAPWAGWGLACVLLLRLLVALRYGHSTRWSVFGHPLSVLAFVVIGLNSMRWSMIGRVRWRGRIYGDEVHTLPGPQEVSS